MRLRITGPVCAALLAGLVHLAGCGGGSENGAIVWSVTSVNPDTSTDLTGGDRVTITGTNFFAAGVGVARFGATPGLNLSILTDTTLEVTTPPAPGGVAQTVTIEVVSTNAGSKLLLNAYTYVGVSGPPQPSTISPTVFSATGAESFIIQGTNLGPPSGTVTVQFVGVGSVTGLVNGTSTIVTGNGSVTPGQPPSTPVTVRVVNGALSGDVPTQIQYAWSAPFALRVWNQSPKPGQTLPPAATRPVRLADGYAVLCSAGANATWSDFDDDVWLVTGPPNAIAVIQLQAPGGAIGYLDPDNSIPAVLDGNTFCLYSVGPDGTPGGTDDRIVQFTSVQSSPTVTRHTIPGINPAPIAAVLPTRIAFTQLGAVAGTASLAVGDFSGTTLTVQHTPIGAVDGTPGPGNFSIPFSSDGDSVYVMSVGPGGAAGDGDDSLWRWKVSLGPTLGNSGAIAAPFTAGRPVALIAGVLAVPAGIGMAPGTNPDHLIVYTDTGTAINTAFRAFTAPLQTAAVVPYTRLGAGGIALTLQGVNAVTIYTNPVSGSPAALQVPQVPLLATLGSLDLLVFDPGPTGNLGDERVRRIDSAGSGWQFLFPAPAWSQGFAATTDSDRGFAVGLGQDGTPSTADEQLLVHQTRALGATADASILPMGIINPSFTPMSGALPFVPVGPGWGLVQSPGQSRAWGDGFDAVVVVRY